MYHLLDKFVGYIDNKSDFLVHTPRAETFGNCAEELLFGLLRAKRENKKILFLCPKNLFFKKIVANQQLFQIRSPLTVRKPIISYVGGWLFTLVIALMWVRSRPALAKVRWLFRWARPKKPTNATFDFFHMAPTLGRSTLWKDEGVGSFSWSIANDQNWKQQYDEFVPPRLGSKDHRRAERFKLQMGIPSSDWFACLHVRESGYRNDADTFRNASIGNYVGAIKAITEVGGWVVRIGDSSMVKLPLMERVVDYPHTKFKNELMDVYLLSHCRLFLGVNSGPYDVATLFKKPVILVNSSEWSIGFPMKQGDLAISKHIFSTSHNRFLSVSEILDEPFTWQGFNSVSDEYVMVENTPGEIRELVEEFLAKKENTEYSNLQNAFNAGRRNQIHRWLDQQSSSERQSEGDIVELYRIAARSDIAAGTLGSKYLEHNWLADNLSLSSIDPSVLRNAGVPAS